ncbi:MAG: phosphomannomutase/phosphoglucomutase [Candidatus Delongbacteria bacterium]|nr:phosphomannomutase/phosphoglucomutase [Candidatus Delongbacteria bacterium]
MNPLTLLSGSDIRGQAETDLNDGFINCLMSVWSRQLKEITPDPLVVIGKDSRISGPRIEECLGRALSRHGIRTIHLVTEPQWKHVSTTPEIFQAVGYFSAAAGIMITASHLPQSWNGLKFFSPEDSYSKDQIRNLLQGCLNDSICDDTVVLPDEITGKRQAKDYLSVYARGIVDLIRRGIGVDSSDSRPLNGLRILTDAGNGASGFFADYILSPLGADIEGSLYLEPDGRFPHHVPNPEDPDAIRDLSAAVVKHRADLGIIFDTDGDRSSVVLPDGRPVTHNRLLALIAAMTLSDHPGSYVVTDSVTSDGLSRFITARGGVHRRFKRGYANVRNEMKRLNQSGLECWAGGETSGHVMFRENRYADDGCYTVARILIYMARLKSRGYTLESVLSELQEPAESRNWRIPIHSDDFQAAGRQCIEHLVRYASHRGLTMDTTEGVRISFRSGDFGSWILVRLSLHEPLLVVNAESDQARGLTPMLDLLRHELAGFGFLTLDF